MLWITLLDWTKSAKPGERVFVKFRLSNTYPRKVCAKLNIWWRQDKIAGDFPVIMEANSSREAEITFYMPDKPENPTKFSLNVYKGPDNPAGNLDCIFGTYNSAPDNFKVFEIEKAGGTPNLVVDRIELDKTEAYVGDIIKATFWFKNTGDATGSKRFEITKDGKYVTAFYVTLDPEESEYHTWTFTFNTAGTHRICADGTCRTVTIKEKPLPDIRVTSLTADKTKIYVGESVTVNVTAKNFGTGEGTKTFDLTVNTKLYRSLTFSLKPGEEKTQSVTITFNVVGIHKVSCGGKTIFITVEEQPHADIRVESITLDKETIFVGEPVKITLKITNFGDAAGSATVPLYINNNKVTSFDVTLGVGESTTRSYTYTFQQAGTYDISSLGKHKTVTVQESPCDTQCEQGQCMTSDLQPCATQCEKSIAGRIDDARLEELFQLARDATVAYVKVCYDCECSGWGVFPIKPYSGSTKKITLWGDLEYDVYLLFRFPEIYSEGECGKYFINKFLNDLDFRERYWDDPDAVRDELRMQFKAQLMDEARQIVAAGGYCNLYCETYKENCIEPCMLEKQTCGSCETSCETSEKETCTTKTEPSCTTLCEQGQCMTSNEVPCQTGCEVSCETTCEKSCQESCEVSCETTCQLSTEACTSTCEVSCQETCEASCQSTTETCVDECQTDCQTECQLTCQVDIEGGCTTTCELSCQTEDQAKKESIFESLIDMVQNLLGVEREQAKQIVMGVVALIAVAFIIRLLR